MSRKDAPVVDTAAFHQREFVEHVANGMGIVDPMSIEANSWATHRDREEKFSTGAEHPLQLARRPSSAGRIQRITVPSEAYVFGDMQAAHGLEGPVAKWKLQHRAGDALEIVHARLQGPNIYERYAGKYRKKPDKVDAGPDIDMVSRLGFGDTVGRPHVLIEVMGVVGRRFYAIPSLGQCIAPAKHLRPWHLAVGTPIFREPHRSARERRGAT
jgi:hypothetical protein